MNNKKRKKYKIKNNINLSYISNKRFLVLSIIVFLLFIIICYKIVDIQLLNREEYKKKMKKDSGQNRI